MRPTSSRARSLRDRKSRARSGAGGRPASWTRSPGRRALRRSACRFPPTSCRRGDGWSRSTSRSSASMGSTWPSALIATLVTVLLFGWLGKLRRRDLEPAPAAPAPAAPAPGGTWLSRSWNTSSEWIAGLFIGPDKDPSLSLFQIFFWTVITVWGLAYVYVVTGSLLSMTQSMMWLLGIAGTGSVIARWISSGTSGGSTSQPPGGSIAIVAAPAGARPKPLAFWQLLSTAGQFDLLKLQLFVFTLLIGAYVAWRIADTGAFPELDTNTLLLLGVSQGVYIGGKIASTTALSRAQALGRPNWT